MGFLKCLLALCIVMGSSAFLTTGCSSAPKTQDSQVVYPPELEQVRKKIAQKHYKDAHGLIDSYLNRSENLQFFGHAYFLKAYIFELEGDVEEAMTFYRRSIQHANGFDSLVQAKALYNLSFTLERKGAFDELMTVLTDLFNRPEHFKALTAQVETQARMSSALASLGQLKKAKQVHARAAASYKKMSRANWFRPKPESLAKALYYLGVVVYPEKNESFSSLEKKLSWGEVYLLKSAESSVGSWSQKATSMLLQGYARLWKKIESFRPEEKNLDPTAAQRAKAAGQLDMASKFYDLLIQVNTEEFPLHKVNRNSKKIIEGADLWKRKLESFALNLKLGPETLREKKVRQTPLVRILDEEWKRRSTPVNKEQTAKSRVLPLPIGAGMKGVADEKIETPSSAPVGSQTLGDEVKANVRPKSVKDKLNKDLKKKFEALPEKDPNL